MEPKVGLLTFRAEGNNLLNSNFYSRKLHWPGISSHCNQYGSGVTLGRGYDMKHRLRNEIISDLISSGIPFEKAKLIAEGSNKSHCSARDFVKENRNKIEDITEIQQLRLFELTYKGYLSDSIRFYNRYKKHDSISWGNLHPILKDVFVDMKYQGVLNQKMVPIFGRNKKNDVIDMIKGNIVILSFEQGRGRIPYIQGGMP
ncbi:hypothetical protein EFZ10_08870 [Tatumella sp. TA1]|nr:hypothetical protein EFZ10_08870 [Tatumella sp. TA1]